MNDFCGREDLVLARVPGITAFEWHLDITRKPFMDRIQVDEFQLDHAGWKGMAENTALLVEQIHLDRWVNDHSLLRQQLQRIRFDFAVFNQVAFAGNVHCDGTIEALSQFLVVHSRAEKFDEVKTASYEQDNHQQGG